MTIYDRLTIGGSTVGDAFDVQVKKSIGTFNASSNFTATLDNNAGKNANIYNIGDEVKIYADKDVNPPTTNIFTGIFENQRFSSRALKQETILQGRDYTARLMDRTVEPSVYTNLLAGSIVKVIIQNYTDDITTTNINNSTTTIQRIAFNHTPVFDAIKDLAELAGFTFYIDNDKDLHFEEKSTSSSGKTFNKTNTIRANFKERRDTVFNEVWVYGDRYLDSFKEEFSAGSPLGGSVFTLEFNPHNTIVDVGSPITQAIRQKGAILNMFDVPISGTDYSVSFFDKEIVFLSGTDLGYDSIPASGAFVTVDYQRSLPIVKVGRDLTSINAYGKRIKRIVDKEIKDPDTAQTRMQHELSENLVPVKQGTLNIRGIIDVTPSQTAVVDFPQQKC